ncbi:DNA methyltransferase [Bifidobacterium margollesii]|uniref:DNA methyltransferase n=1 Tax=Bifidobacterium margollesii TaxID=2020964 RepID=UPI000C76C6C9|nr:DNA methyltransferase [Bifidobacterium margollesii]
MRWLIRTYTQPGDPVVDPFAGSGSTAVAAALEGRRCLAVERDPQWAAVGSGTFWRIRVWTSDWRTRWIWDGESGVGGSPSGQPGSLPGRHHRWSKNSD